MQSMDGEAVVLMLSLSDMDMEGHDGELVRVEGALDTTSTGGAVKILLLPAARDMEEAVLLCQQPLQHRSLRMGQNPDGLHVAGMKWKMGQDPSYGSPGTRVRRGRRD